MRLIFAGTPDFAKVILDKLLTLSEHEVVAVYTQPDRPKGRGKQLQASPVKQLALAHNIAVEQPENFKSAEALDKLKSYDVDLMIVVAYGLLLPQAVLDTPKQGCWNIHASLLPRWRGAAPIQRAIEAGDAETGVCIMQMDAGLDTGDVLLEKRCEIIETETTVSLHDKLAQLGADAITKALQLYQDQGDALKRIKQDDLIAQGAEAVYAKKMTKAEGEINWHESAAVIERKIRAFDPWPGCYFEYKGQVIKVWQAQVIPPHPQPLSRKGRGEQGNCTKPDQGRGEQLVGEVIRVGKDGVDFTTAEGVLRLLEIQLPGAKRQHISDVLNGHPDLFE